MADLNASSASTEQCIFILGRPPNASATALFDTFNASSIVVPLTQSVTLLEVAMAAPHPNVLNFASVMTSLSSTLM